MNISRWLSCFRNDSGLAAEALASAIVTAEDLQHIAQPTLAAHSTAYIEQVIYGIDQLAVALCDLVADAGSAAIAAIQQARQTRSAQLRISLAMFSIAAVPHLVDLGRFCENLIGPQLLPDSPYAPAVRAAADQLFGRVKQPPFRIALKERPNALRHLHGTAIYFPELGPPHPDDLLARGYLMPHGPDDEVIEFVQASQWVEFLRLWTAVVPDSAA